MIQSSEGSSSDNGGAGTTGSPNGKDKTPIWDKVKQDAQDVPKDVVGGILTGFILAKASAKEQIVKVQKVVAKVPGAALVKSACILGTSIVTGCVILVLGKEPNQPAQGGSAPQKPAGDSFAASPAEVTCWDNMLYLLDHP